MSQIVGSLPVPRTVQEAMRLRERPEIKSYRNIFLNWCDNMYKGDVPEAEYIKKDFDAAKNFFWTRKDVQNAALRFVAHVR